jgi:hypothetical protein
VKLRKKYKSDFFFANKKRQIAVKIGFPAVSTLFTTFAIRRTRGLELSNSVWLTSRNSSHALSCQIMKQPFGKLSRGFDEASSVQGFLPIRYQTKPLVDPLQAFPSGFDGASDLELYW